MATVTDSSLTRPADPVIAPRFGSWYVGLALLFCALVTYTRSVYYFDHNDFMYASSATRSGHLYQDLHYVQAPLGFWFWRAVYLFAPDGQAYPTMRLVSASLTFLALIPPLLLLRGRHLVQVALLLGITSSHFVLRAGMEIGNYSLSLFLFSIGFCVMFSEYRARYLLTGVAFGLAAATKLSFAIFPFPALITVILMTRTSGDLIRAILAGVFGFLLGVLPVLYFLLGDTDAFILHNITFHSEITNAYRGVLPSGSLLSIEWGLIRFCEEYVFELLVILTFLLGSTLSVRQAGRTSWQVPYFALGEVEHVRLLYVVTLFLASALTGAISPMVMFDQYLIVPGFILVCGLCLLLDRVNDERSRVILLVYIAVSVVRGSFLILPVAVQAFNQPSALTDHVKTTRKLNDIISETGPPEGCTNEIFTLSGSFVIDSGLPLSAYTEAGVFWARLVDHIPDRYRHENSSSFDRNLTEPLEHILRNDTAYVLIGYYPNVQFERDLMSKFEELDFTSAASVPFQGRALELLVRKNCGK